MTLSTRHSPIRLTLWVCLAMLVGFVLIRVVPMWSVTSIWDDAFFFARYANNLVEHGAMMWNPGEAPSYGLTSQLYMLIVVPLRLLFPNSPGLIMLLASMLCGAAFLISVMVLIWRDSEQTAVSRLVVMVAVMAVLASSAALAVHFSTGMDTMFVMAFLTIYLILAQEYRQTASVRNMVAMGVWGGLAYFARPDLMLYTLIVPGMMIILSPDWPSAKRGMIVVAISVMVAALQAGFATVYYQSPVPLPFYNKQLGVIERPIPELFRAWPGLYLTGFGNTYLPFLIVIAASLLVGYRRWLRRSATLEIGALIATVLFIMYYRFSVFQVMPYQQRFYHPTLPAIIFLAARSLTWFRSQLPELSRLTLFNNPAAGVSIPVVLALAMTINLYQLNRDGESHARGDGQWFGVMDVTEDYRLVWSHYLYGLDRISALPPDLVIATTEIGLPGVMNPDKIIFDMSGLTDRGITTNGFSSDYLFTKYLPDVLYLPSFDYSPDKWKQINDHPFFREHYLLFNARQLDAALDVAIYKDSAYYDELEAIMKSPGS